jgi:hypothetical protein
MQSLAAQDMGLTDKWQYGSTRQRSGVTRRPLALEGARKEGFGRSRGGFTSKIHIRADGQGRSIGFVLAGAEVSNYKAVQARLDLPLDPPRMMLADNGYDGEDVRSSLLMHRILPFILPKANRRGPIGCDFKAYKDRIRSERRTQTPRGRYLQWQVNSTDAVVQTSRDGIRRSPPASLCCNALLAIRQR